MAPAKSQQQRISATHKQCNPCTLDLTTRVPHTCVLDVRLVGKGRVSIFPPRILPSEHTSNAEAHHKMARPETIPAKKVYWSNMVS